MKVFFKGIVCVLKGFAASEEHKQTEMILLFKS